MSNLVSANAMLSGITDDVLPVAEKKFGGSVTFNKKYAMIVLAVVAVGAAAGGVSYYYLYKKKNVSA